MKTQLIRVCLGGLLGTAVMTAMMYFAAPMMTGQKTDIAAMLGSMLGDSWALGMAAHWINGALVFPAIYALALYRLLPGPPVARGIAWGLALWLIAQMVVMPMVGAGFFSANAGGFKAVMASLLTHVIYGAILGGVAGRVVMRDAPAG